VCLAALPALVGCVEAPADSSDADSRVYFNPLERRARTVREVEVPEPPLSLEENERIRRIVGGFRERALTLFRRDDPDRPVDEIERIFRSTGKYLELAGIYQGVVAEQGVESDAAPRLAWILVRLGQERQARELLDRLLKVRPESALVHFVDGSFWFNRAPESREAAARTVVSWRRALERDPEFEGPERLDASALRRKIRRIEGRLPEEPESILARSDEGDGGLSSEGDGPVGASDDREQPSELDEGGQEADDGGESRAGTADAFRESGRASDTGATDTGATDRRESGASADAGADAGPSAPLLLTRADLALRNGEIEEARRLYRRILEEREERQLEAEFGLIRTEQRAGVDAAKLVEQLRALVDRSDLTARLAYSMHSFARGTLDAPGLAEQFRERVRELDPEYAEKMGLGAP